MSLTDDQIDQMLLSDDHYAGRVQQERECRRLALSETYPGVPFVDAVRLQRIDAELERGPFDGHVDREQLWRERGAILATHDPQSAQALREVGAVAPSEAPAAGPSQRRPVTPPSAPMPASEQQLDALYAHLRPEHAHHLTREQEGEAVELAERRAQRRYSDAEVAQARFVRFAWPDALSLDERAAIAQGDEQGEREQYREELRDLSERVNASHAETQRLLAKVERQTKRRDRAAGVVLPKSK